ncbi:MAG TPA: hypothetical protein EYQ54_18625 [Myxococcales bacterium]|nr:hypothetical protein [Myxococcales bacterium]
MQRTDTLWRRGQFCRGMAGLTVLLLTLSWAGSAFAEQSVEAQRQAVIQGILDDNAGDPAGLVDAIKNIFGDLQGDEAVARAKQILDALPSELSDAQWASIKTAIGDKASDLVSSSASQSIMSQLAAKESALGKTQKAGDSVSSSVSQSTMSQLAAKESALGKTLLQAKVITDEGDPADGGDARESSRASSAPMAPPQDQVDCTSASCQ